MCGTFAILGGDQNSKDAVTDLRNFLSGVHKWRSQFVIDCTSIARAVSVSLRFGDSMTRRICLCAAITLLLAATTVVRAAETMRIVPITSADSVVVSVELSDAYNADIRQAISSGLRTQ